MPSHCTPKELAERKRRAALKATEPKLLDLFCDQENENRFQITERIVENNGHHWKVRECKAYSEHIQID